MNCLGNEYDIEAISYETNIYTLLTAYISNSEYRTVWILIWSDILFLSYTEYDQNWSVI